MSLEAGPTRHVARSLLSGGAVPGVAATVLSAVVALIVSGTEAAGSAVAGGLLVLAAFAVGPLVMRAGRDVTPAGLQAMALGAYILVVFALGFAYVLLDGAGWFRGVPAGIAVLVVSAAWLGGQLQRTAGLRILAFGERSPAESPER